jgi:hypothetical protein
VKLCISSLCINGYAKESPPLHPLLQANYSFTADKMRLIKEPKYELRARLQKYNIYIYIDILENYAFQRIVVCKKMALEGMKRSIVTGTLCNTIEQWDSDMLFHENLSLWPVMAKPKSSPGGPESCKINHLARIG